MAPIPTNNTGRLVIRYQANGQEHSSTMRYDGVGAPPSGFLEGVDDLLTAINPLMPEDWAFTDWFYYAQGSIVSQPLTGGPTPFDGQVPVAPQDAPGFISFVGRDLSGRRTKVVFLGAGVGAILTEAEATDYRLSAAENAGVASILGFLESVGLVTVNQGTPVWRQYMNLGYAGYWQRKVRG